MAIAEPRMLPHQPENLMICNICKKPLTKADLDGGYPPLCDPCLTFVCQDQKD